MYVYIYEWARGYRSSICASAVHAPTVDNINRKVGEFKYIATVTASVGRKTCNIYALLGIGAAIIAIDVTFPRDCEHTSANHRPE